MRRLILKMQVSLDGYIEGRRGAMDWFDASDAESWEEEFRLLRRVDTLLLGRGMYPDYAAYWSAALTTPGSPKNDVKYARLAEKVPHIVFSRTLKKEQADFGDTRIARGDLTKEVRALKRRRGKALLALGGAKFAAALLDRGLVDEYQLVVNPVLLGGGKSLFEGARRRRELALRETKKYRNGAILLRYFNS